MQVSSLVILITILAIGSALAAMAWKVMRLWAAKKKRESMEALLAEAEPRIVDAMKEIASLFNYSHYITESERANIADKYGDLYATAQKLVKYFVEEKNQSIEPVQRFHTAMSDTPGYKSINNENFIKNQLRNHCQYFDSVLAYPLDQQQREAVVSLEDNVLVISSAGSGKTMTTVGKVRYLIDKQGIDPAKILLITFTRKAAESLSERLGEKKLKCVTFHKLALDIISQSTGQKPSLTAPDFSIQVYERLMKEDAKFKTAITDYILRSRYKMRDQFEYNSTQEYMQDRKSLGIQSYYTDMDGRSVYCKSDEENQIADYLGSRGIKFRYEEKYELPTADSEHRQYTPDFSIHFKDADGHERRIYLEHFAINEEGHCPKWFGKGDEERYLKDKTWKEIIHEQNGTMLIETSSADFHTGVIFEKLEDMLTNLGITIGNSQNAVSHELVKQEQNIIALLSSFNFLMKSKGLQMNEVLNSCYYGPDRATLNLIVAPFIEAYKQLEDKVDEIDFTDAIIRATELCNSGHRPDYDYILVDEFQDISTDRYAFLQSLRRNQPLTKLFCVGDDWQSIYRFAGSDMALFKSFSKFFGFTKECRMETTYRFGNPLIEKSSKFILTNPDQKEKNVRSFSEDAMTKIDFIPTFGRGDVAQQVRCIIDSIPYGKDIYLLGRYSFDINILTNSFFEIQDSNGKVTVIYNGREITFMTVHQSKGLESDYVILLNCNSGCHGFPADIADSPILKYVLSEPDGYEYGEERRVFYVGITRAKQFTYVLYDNEHPSPFIAEFVDGIRMNSDEEVIPESDLCPVCHCGRIQTLKKGTAVNGNPYYIVACSNRIHGCTYQETQFVNLNKKSRRIGYK